MHQFVNAELFCRPTAVDSVAAVRCRRLWFTIFTAMTFDVACNYGRHAAFNVRVINEKQVGVGNAARPPARRDRLAGGGKRASPP